MTHLRLRPVETDYNSNLFSCRATPDFAKANYESLSQEPNDIEFTIYNALKTLEDHILPVRAKSKINFEDDIFLENLEVDSNIVLAIAEELDDDNIDLDVVQFATGEDLILVADQVSWDLHAVDVDDEQSLLFH